MTTRLRTEQEIQEALDKGLLVFCRYSPRGGLGVVSVEQVRTEKGELQVSSRWTRWRKPVMVWTNDEVRQCN